VVIRTSVAEVPLRDRAISADYDARPRRFLDYRTTPMEPQIGSAAATAARSRPGDPNEVRVGKPGGRVVNELKNDVTLRLLRYFETLAAELNYRRAAELLYISQPALSSAISQLERLIDDRLFDRDTRSVALTALGREWLPHVRAALREVDAALDAVEKLVDHAPVRIGYLIGTGADLLFQLLESNEEHELGIQVETVEYDFSDPTAGLADNAVDIALLRPPVELKNVEMALVSEESWVACLPRTHRFAARESIDISELLDDPIVVAPESAGRWRDYWLAADLRKDRPAVVAAVADTYESEVTHVARGTGISFTVSSSMRLYERPGVRFVPLTGRPTTHTALAWRPDRLSPSGRQVVQHMLNRIPQVS
jgi:DNA-binding transcriptional LysR family regulator